VLVEMVFLANVFVPCDVCGGKRFKKDVLDVKLGGSSIHDVLEWTVDQALQRFHRQPRLARALWHLQQVGLGYLRLGQPATTLSGGEAQRLKIAASWRSRAGKVAGEALHPRRADHGAAPRRRPNPVPRARPARRCGHTVLVIEHHLDVVKRADWVIELGPGAGDAGGRVVAQGRPRISPAAPILPPAAISETSHERPHGPMTRRQADLALLLATRAVGHELRRGEERPRGCDAVRVPDGPLRHRGARARPGTRVRPPPAGRELWAAPCSVCSSRSGSSRRPRGW